MTVTNKKPAKRLYYVGYNFWGCNHTSKKSWSVFVFTTKKEADEYVAKNEKTIRIKKTDVIKILGKESYNTEYKYLETDWGYTEMIRESF